jgi:NTE family protein
MKMKNVKTALILQGGGALGAYQAGVYERLHEFTQNKTPITWVIGTSIGAINAAIIAGNPPELRVEKIRGFWDSLKPENNTSLSLNPVAQWQKMLSNWVTDMMGMGGHSQTVIKEGVNGFFIPRNNSAPMGYVDIYANRPILECSFYDTSPLKETLEKYVDFDYLNKSETRISVSAVDIENGQQRVFDSKIETIIPEHIMASGALPPGFPAVEIDGHMYWDGGIYSNTPLEILLQDGTYQNTLCFMVDLWNPREQAPENIYGVMSRWKTIQYTSRLRERFKLSRKIHDIRASISDIGALLTPEQRDDERFKDLLKYADGRSINVIHLIMQASDDDYFKDIDFRAKAVDDRWALGVQDADRALQHSKWLKPMPKGCGLVIHDLNDDE